MTKSRERIGSAHIVVAITLFTTMVTGDAAIIVATSPSHGDVAAAVSAATYGDTVQVPVGTATWNSSISLSKYITLSGAGAGSTIIKGALAGISSPILNISPDTQSIADQGLFRISGFTFDGNNSNCRGIMIGHDSSTVVYEQIRIDNNRFFDFAETQAVRFSGMIEGLVDNNVFENSRGVYVLGKHWYSWEVRPIALGTSHSIYVENNLFRECELVCGGGHGGRYVFRYNTIYDQQGRFPILDVHGNQQPVTAAYRPSGSRGMPSTEIYHNVVANLTAGARFIDLRGGTAIIFGNALTNTAHSASIRLREEDGTDRSNFLATYPAYDPVKNSYIFHNQGISVYVGGDGGAHDSTFFIKANRDFWKEASSFDGTQGVGVGVYANMPTSAVENVGYWATDRGTLYRFDSSGSWVEHYVPYTYPHPMSSGGTQLLVPANFRTDQ